MIRKKLLSMVASGILLCVALPLSVSADQTREQLIEEIRARLAELKRQVDVLQQAQFPVSTQPAEFPSAPKICSRPTFTLLPGTSSGEVTELQKFLSRYPELYPEGLVTGYYGLLTEAAVRRFQQKYGVVTFGNPETTGFGRVGPKTLIAMGRFCMLPTPLLPSPPLQLFPVPLPTPPVAGNKAPVITATNGPDSLRIEETGTWVVSAYDPERETLFYTAHWDDSGIEPETVSGSQAIIFTHSYAVAGTYNPVFTVRDSKNAAATSSASVEIQGSRVIGGLRISVGTDKTAYGSGEKIQITVEATNTTNETKTLNFTSGCQASYAISSVFNLESNLVCTQVLTSVVISPNLSKTWIMTHGVENYQLVPGSYAVKGKVIGYGEATAGFTVKATLY